MESFTVFVKKYALPVFGVVVIVVVVYHVGARLIDWSSVDTAGDENVGDATVVACGKPVPLSGESVTVSLTRRPSVFENWVKARSSLIADARTEAEEGALDSFKDLVDDADCPEECPEPEPSGNVSYATSNSRITGSKGFGYIRYDGSATSQASGTYICKA